MDMRFPRYLTFVWNAIRCVNKTVVEGQIVLRIDFEFAFSHLLSKPSMATLQASPRNNTLCDVRFYLPFIFSVGIDERLDLSTKTQVR